MSQKPLGNNASSKPPAYIPPVKRPGQIPPLYQPPIDSLKSAVAESEPAVSGGPADIPPSAQPPEPPAEQAIVDASSPCAVPHSAAFPSPDAPASHNAAGPGTEHPELVSQGGSVPPPPGYYRPVPRRQRADYQYLSKRSFTFKGSAAVLFSLLFCICFTEMVLWGNLGLSVLILAIAYCLFSFWYFRESDSPFPPAAMLIFIPIAVLACGLCLSVNSATSFITFPFLICLAALQTALLSGMQYRSLFSWETFGALWTRLVDGPLSFLDFPFLVMMGRGKEKKKSKSLWKIFLGLLCALPVVILLLGLFAKADAVFRTGLQTFLRWLRVDWSRLAADLLIGFVGSIFLAAVLLYCRGALPRKVQPARRRRFVDPLFSIPFLGIVDLSVMAFTIVQFAYLFGGQKGSLPGGYTYSEYARQGFFELATALFLVFSIALFFMALSKTEHARLHLAVRLELLFLSLGGGVILVSAVKRMLLYVSVYGMSVKRGLTLWFMITAGICFLFLAARCLIRRFPLAKCAGITVITMICLLSLFPMDGFVARYNVNAYLSGHTETQVDYWYLEERSVSALPAMVDLYLHEPSDELEEAINNQIRKNDCRHPIWGWTVDQISIRKSIDIFRQTAEGASSSPTPSGSNSRI